MTDTRRWGRGALDPKLAHIRQTQPNRTGFALCGCLVIAPLDPDADGIGKCWVCTQLSLEPSSGVAGCGLPGGGSSGGGVAGRLSTVEMWRDLGFSGYDQRNGKLTPENGRDTPQPAITPAMITTLVN